MYIYHPMNLDLQAKTAKSHSRSIVLENVKNKIFSRNRNVSAKIILKQIFSGRQSTNRLGHVGTTSYQ